MEPNKDNDAHEANEANEDNEVHEAKEVNEDNKVNEDNEASENKEQGSQKGGVLKKVAEGGAMGVAGGVAGGVGGAGLMAATQTALSVIGFQTAGVAAGSIAAGAQTSAVVAGSTFAACQSVGATGALIAIAPAVAGVGVAVGAVLGIGWFMKKQFSKK